MPFRRLRYAFLLFVPAILLAFWPGYFAQPRAAAIGVHVHALTALAWLGLLALQLWSIHARRDHWHRRAGRAVFVVVPLFVAGGALAIQAMAVKTLAGHPFYAHTGAGLGLVDAIATPMFLALVAYGLRRRRDPHAHGAAMLATAVLVLPPVLARLLPPIGGFGPAFHASQAIALLVAIVAAGADRRHSRPFVAVAACCAVQSLAFATLAHTPMWQRLFTGMVNVPMPALALPAATGAAVVLWLAWRGGGAGARQTRPAPPLAGPYSSPL